MADTIKRPTTGPTKSTNEAGERLDAAVPNPDFYCEPTGEYNFYLTTKPYPIYSFDSLEEIHNILYIGMVVQLPITIADAMWCYDATLEHKIGYGYYTHSLPENFQDEMWCYKGELKQIIGYLSFGWNKEHVSDEVWCYAATLTHVIGYVFIDQPPEEFDEDLTITGITLT